MARRPVALALENGRRGRVVVYGTGPSGFRATVRLFRNGKLVGKRQVTFKRGGFRTSFRGSGAGRYTARLKMTVGERSYTTRAR
jgi:hypothetical protein